MPSLIRFSVAQWCGTLCLALPAALLAQPAASRDLALRDSTPGARLPFSTGEVLDYKVNVSFGGNIGQGQMRVEGPVLERGVSTWRLVSEMRAKRAFVKATDKTTSWIDPLRMATTRFEKVERHPLSNSSETVEMDLAAGTWREVKGEAQALASQFPLDELSFLYFLRTLPLDKEGSHNFNRHFDDTRNPTMVTVGAEEVVETPLGAFPTRVVIMHVRDPKHYKGVGLIKINIELSACRLPVRIVSRMPIVGTTTLTLVGRTDTPHRCDP
jgi:Protein of unknown function (DUF3108)